MFSEQVDLVVVIPSYNERDISSTLYSIDESAVAFKKKVGVIVVVNASESSPRSVFEQNEKTLIALEQFKKGAFVDLHIVNTILPLKFAGVGLARKTGMDLACNYFLENNLLESLIVSLDADTTVQKNYFYAIDRHFSKNLLTHGCSIYFEHAKSENPLLNQAIIWYELHLRYYKMALAFCKLPYAYHTVGSCMVVKAEIYKKQGGMNKRKAGEDFYFLQKVITLGQFSEINTTVVKPSPRNSDRVPFGTGRAVRKILENNNQELLSYNFLSVKALKEFSNLVPQFYSSEPKIKSKVIADFLSKIDFEINLEKIRNNATSKEHFSTLFFKWFNAFKVLKYFHFARDNYYQNNAVVTSARELYNEVFTTSKNRKNAEYWLKLYREWERRG